MSKFFKNLCRAAKNLFKSKEKPTPEPDIPDNPEDNNIDPDKPDDGGNYEIYPDDAEKLYYPKAIRTNSKLRTRGFYIKGYPQGAVVHSTAGRGRNREEGGRSNVISKLALLYMNQFRMNKINSDSALLTH